MSPESTRIVVEQSFSLYMILPAVLIALATFGATWWATHQAHALDRARRREAEQAELEAVLWGIHAELVTLVERYQETLGHELERCEREGQSFEGFLLAEQSYFTIYETSAAVLGRLDDPALAAAIVKNYTYLRALIDMHVLQRRMLETPKGDRGEAWRKLLKTQEKRLFALHHQAVDMTRETVRLLKARHGPLREGADEEFTHKTDAS